MRNNSSFNLNGRKLTILKTIDMVVRKRDHRYMISTLRNYETHLHVDQNDGILILLRLEFLAEAVCAKLSAQWVDGSSLPYKPFSKRMTNVHLSDKREHLLCERTSNFRYADFPTMWATHHPINMETVDADFVTQSIMDLPVNTEISYISEFDFVRTSLPSWIGFEPNQFVKLIVYLMEKNGFVQN